MTSGSRLPTWKERENNKRRERRRRAIAAKIYQGLRMYGNYKLPKHCDNNEVLKALCAEAGWTVEEDGTTYRKGCLQAERMDISGGASASISPCSSYHPSPAASYHTSPASSSFPSPGPSYHASPASSNFPSPGPSYAEGGGATSYLIPWLKNLGGGMGPNMGGAACRGLPPLRMGSNSAPVTPPLSSPTARGPRPKPDWDATLGKHSSSSSSAASAAAAAAAAGGSEHGFSISGAAWQNYPFLSAPASPARRAAPLVVVPEALDLSDAAAGKGRWVGGVRVPGPSSPTFSLLSPAARLEHSLASASASAAPFFGLKQPESAESSRMWTPMQSGRSSPSNAVGANHVTEVLVAGSSDDDFRFECGNAVTVKPWEGERIHEECGGEIASDDLELTLGNSRQKSKPDHCS
uniref:TSA: Wollemia nobilis Ref_Wollemi_Transcript_3646_1537 transcribed RNA sequence n=1 Tax=Wollemia nobilis TaxID=56998 RepID=A0A0C9QWP4_9CONI